MTKDNRTVEIVILLDRSGSMENVRDETIGGFNAFIAEQREIEGEAFLTLVLFDHEYTPLLQGVPIASVRPLDRTIFVPRGSTALLDAWGRAMAETEARLAGRARPDEVIFVVMTDGYENASQEWTAPRIFAAVQQRTDLLGWRFIYLGANQDAIAVAESYGVSSKTALGYIGDGEGAKTVIGTLSHCISRVRKGQGGEDLFTDEERDEAQGRPAKKKRLLH
jgi:hypothetical protein